MQRCDLCKLRVSETVESDIYMYMYMYIYMYYVMQGLNDYLYVHVQCIFYFGHTRKQYTCAHTHVYGRTTSKVKHYIAA